MEGMINDLVDDPDRCEWRFLSSALPGDGGVGVMTGTHAAYGSQFQGHLGSRAVESLHGNTSSPHRGLIEQSVPTDEPVSYPR